MKLFNAVLFSACLASLAACGGGQPPAASDRALEHAGWEKLGERDINGAVDHERVVVGRADGKFRMIMVEVKREPVELYDLSVTFGDDQHWEPGTRLVFDANTRSREIELPGGERFIKHVDFKMRGLAGGAVARVELFGK
jgi:hypothetical protein